MPTGPAARIFDPVVHPLPPVLQPGPGSMNTIIGFKLAWRGIPLAAVGALVSAKSASDIAIKTAEAATLAAAGTPGAPAAKLAEETLKAQQAVQMGSMITAAAGGADIHMCATPLPLPPHGPGVVIDGSPTVMINNLPACRQGDSILEALGPINKIALGLPTVIIGQMGRGCTVSASPGMGAQTPSSSPVGSGGEHINVGKDTVGPMKSPGPGGSSPPAVPALKKAAQSGAAVVSCGEG